MSAWALACLSLGPAQAQVEEAAEAVLLVAAPALRDSVFARTVVLVTFPQDTGPMGVVLNRPSGISLGALFRDARPNLGGVDDPVYLGGPVEPEGLLFVFRATEHPVRALPAADGLFLSGDGALFESLLDQSARSGGRRFFAGHAAWAEGQLDAEIQRGDWLVLPAEAATVLDTAATETLWERLYRRAAGRAAWAARPVLRPVRPARG